MGLTLSSKLLPFLFLLQLSFVHHCFGSRKLASLYIPPPISMTYHNGALLQGDLHVSILWYGQFTPPQKSILLDFLQSLNPPQGQNSLSTTHQPSVFKWWQTIDLYMKKAGKQQIRVVLHNQISDEGCSKGKILKKLHITELAQITNSGPNELTLVLTSKDVAVEGFCLSNCGFHGSLGKTNSTFIWVGNSVTQCPGQCAWPFHQPIYGSQGAPLGAPNGDVGVDGMVVNIASLMAGTVTNPFGNGYFQGSAEMPLEAASACSGLYGKGAYPGYAGELQVDMSTGGSYNAQGANGRKYLLPALFNPDTSSCTIMV